jgi:PAS domain S-box-containing protein
VLNNPTYCRMKIQKQIIYIAFLSFGVTAGFIWLSYVNHKQTVATQNWVNHTNETIKELNNIASYITNVESGTRGYVISDSSIFIQDIPELKNDITKTLSHVKVLTADDLEQKPRITVLERIIDEKLKLQGQIAELKKEGKGGADKVVSSLRGKVAMDSIYLVLNQMKDYENGLLQKRMGDNKAIVRRTLNSIFITAVIYVPTILFFLWVLNNNITRRTQAEQKARASEKQLRVLMKSVREGFFMLDQDLSVVVTNFDSNKDFFRYIETDSVKGKHFVSFFPEKERLLAVEELNAALSGNSGRFEVKYTDNGILSWMQVSCSPIYSHSGRITGVAVLTEDITEKKRSEIKLKESESKLNTIIETTKDGYFLLDTEYSIVMMNEAARTVSCQIYGQPFQIGDSLLKFADPERRKLLETVLVQVINERTPQYNILDLDTSLGKKWFESYYFPVLNEKDITGICISCRDVSEKKIAEAIIKDSALKLQSIINSTQDGFYLIDENYQLVTCNEAGRNITKRIYGTTLNPGDSLMKFTPTERKKAIEERLANVMAGFPDHSEFKIESKDGEIWFETFYYPVLNNEQQVTGICVSSRDITERVHHHQQLVAAKKAAESAERLQETFLANMSHEIRTPMNGIVGMTDILMGTPLTKEQREFVQIIKQSSDTLLFLINDILDLSKIKAGKLTIEKAPFNLNDVIDSVLAPFILKAQEKNIELRITERPDVPLHLLGDRYRLVQILNNLLSNAVKFTSKGHVWLSVKQLLLTKTDTVLEFSVVDTGIGIPEEKVEAIFNSFEQGSDGTTRKYGGTGLGLAITKNLIELQGGEIGVTSFEKKGTTFVFILKFRLLNEVPLQTKPSIDTINFTKTLQGKHILVVEDNEINQKVISHNLEYAGLDVTIACNGKEAVDLLERGDQYDLVIMDLQMPEMNGFQAAIYIRNKLQMNIPIIAMTASVMRNERVKCMAVGMNDYISKPFDNAMLFMQMNRLLGVEMSEEYNAGGNKLSNELYDLAYLREMDDRAYLAEVLELFLQTVPVLINKIHEGVLHNQPVDIFSSAHKLKTSLGLLRMHRMLQFNTEIELRTRDQRTIDDKQLAEISAALKSLKEQFQLVKPLIEAELNEAKSVQL